ncbi:hypothetical protein BDV38DRAFT_254638 [Aspergillus pseudotamarii]|uniref:Uncharacterized protein n=1 Tax=Aspergillus pseudotamarii TaxID=132259 RepID=A0A5N6SIP2_ASPPS|nr:uncharacterized protein BDV38DRAFT_254638 [Aspergillus pseudotamarii]KAE8134556.1 hypothetical protein BDV38DRAFT_254638 [Aspergillus pseudotamarii]
MRSTPLSISKCDSNEALSTESRRWLEKLAIVSTCFCFGWLNFLFFCQQKNWKSVIQL